MRGEAGRGSGACFLLTQYVPLGGTVRSRSPPCLLLQPGTHRPGPGRTYSTRVHLSALVSRKGSQRTGISIHPRTSVEGFPVGGGVPTSSLTVNSTEEGHPSMSLSSQDSLSNDTDEAVWPLSLRSLLGPPLGSPPSCQREGAQVSTAAQVQQARLSPPAQLLGLGRAGL